MLLRQDRQRQVGWGGTGLLAAAACPCCWPAFSCMPHSAHRHQLCYTSSREVNTITPVRHSEEDAMKSILLPIDQSEQMPSALETARLLANLFEGTVEGVALRPAFAEIVAPDPIVAVTIPPADWNETEFCRGVRQTFDGFATAHPAGQGSGARFRWRGGSAIEDSTLGSLARVYDLTVLSRPGARGSRMSALEAALFDSGH